MCLAQQVLRYVGQRRRQRGQRSCAGAAWRGADWLGARAQAFAEAAEQLARGAFRPVRGRSLVTELALAGPYYLAEKYHQQYLARGGRFGMAQSAEKGATDKIRCYG